MRTLLTCLLFAGGPGTFNHDLLYIELGLITLFLMLAYGPAGIKYLRNKIVSRWHQHFHPSTETHLGEPK